jgi:hypothetical protein
VLCHPDLTDEEPHGRTSEAMHPEAPLDLSAWCLGALTAENIRSKRLCALVKQVEPTWQMRLCISTCFSEHETPIERGRRYHGNMTIEPRMESDDRISIAPRRLKETEDGSLFSSHLLNALLVLTVHWESSFPSMFWCCTPSKLLPSTL